MCSGKDVFHGLLALLLALCCVGCFLEGGTGLPRRDGGRPTAESQARTRITQPSGPVALAEPRPVQPASAPIPPPVQTSPAPSPAPVAQPTPPPSGPEVPTAAPTSPPVDPQADARRLHRTAAERHAGIESFIARLQRRELVSGKKMPLETLSFKFRRQPFSVHFKWLTEPGLGREVVYVKGQYGDNIHTLTAAGDVPLLRGGMKIALAPNDPRVLARSRHPISEAGLGTIIDRLGRVITALDRGDQRLGTLKYLGQQARPEYPTPLEGIEQTIPPGCEPDLPRGGRRLVFFDPSIHLPVMVITYDEKGQEAEFYCFDRFLFVKLDDDDFNPDKLWRKP